MKIFLAADHAGFALKEKLKPFLTSLGHEIEDCGAFVFNAEDDYPDFVVPCAKKVAGNAGSVGIVIGGSGQGEAMAANRVPGIRAAVWYGDASGSEIFDEAGGEITEPFASVRLSRTHNDANILSLGARFITDETGEAAVRIFLSTPFPRDSRHLRRIQKF